LRLSLSTGRFVRSGRTHLPARRTGGSRLIFLQPGRRTSEFSRSLFEREKATAGATTAGVFKYFFTTLSSRSSVRRVAAVPSFVRCETSDLSTYCGRRWQRWAEVAELVVVVKVLCLDAGTIATTRAVELTHEVGKKGG